MGSSGNKNVQFIGSKLTRFDAHNGVHCVKLIDSELRMVRTNGSGDFIMENCKMYNRLLIGLREDYGGSLRGDILIKNVTMDPGEAYPILISNTWYNHYFGYPTFMPETIVIDNFQLTKGNEVHIFSPNLVSQLDNAWRDEVDGKPNVNKMIPPKKIIIRNNKSKLKYILPESDFFKDTEIIFED